MREVRCVSGEGMEKKKQRSPEETVRVPKKGSEEREQHKQLQQSHHSDCFAVSCTFLRFPQRLKPLRPPKKGFCE